MSVSPPPAGVKALRERLESKNRQNSEAAPRPAKVFGTQPNGREQKEVPEPARSQTQDPESLPLGHPRSSVPDEAEAMMREAEEEVERLRIEVDQQRREADQHKRAAHEIAKAAKEAKKEAAATKKLLEDEREHSKRNSEQANRVIDDLQAQLRHLHESPPKVVTNQADLSSLKQQLDELRAQSSQMISELKRKDEIIQKKSEENENLQQDVRNNLNLASIRTSEMAVLQDEFQNLRADCQRLLEEREQRRTVEVDLTKQLEEAYRSIHSMDAGSVQTLPPSDANMQQLMKLQDDLVQELNDMKSDMAKLAARNKALGEEKTRLERSCLEQQASTGERQSLASHCQTLEEDNVRLQQEMRAFTEIWQREKEDYESKLLSFAEYQKNAQVFRKEHEDLEKKVNGFANLAYAWENEKKAYETKVQELEALNARLQTHVLELQHQLDTQQSPSPPKLLKDDARRLKQEIERLQGIIQKQSHELLRKHGNSKEPESSRSNRDRLMLIELQEYILNIKEESEAINGLKKHLEKQKAESAGDGDNVVWTNGFTKPPTPPPPTDDPSACTAYSSTRSLSPPRSVLHFVGEDDISRRYSSHGGGALTYFPKLADTRASAILLRESAIDEALASFSDEPLDDSGDHHGHGARRAFDSATTASSKHSASPKLKSLSAHLVPDISDDILNYQPPSTAEVRKNRLQAATATAVPQLERSIGVGQPSKEHVSSTAMTPSEYLSLRDRNTTTTSLSSSRSSSTPSQSSTPVTTQIVSTSSFKPSDYLKSRGLNQTTTGTLRQSSSAPGHYTPQMPSHSQVSSMSNMSAERMAKFAEYQEMLENQGPEDWEQGLSGVELMPDGSFKPARARSLTPVTEHHSLEETVHDDQNFMVNPRDVYPPEMWGEKGSPDIVRKGKDARERIQPV